MDIQALRYAVTLAEELHFRKAAERHYIAPQAFGRHVRALEKEVGARLFDRTSRRVTLTPAGVRLVERACDVLARVDDLAAAVRDAPSGKTTRIGASGTSASERPTAGPRCAASCRRSSTRACPCTSSWTGTRSSTPCASARSTSRWWTTSGRSTGCVSITC